MTAKSSLLTSPPTLLLSAALFLAACLVHGSATIAGLGQHFEVTEAEPTPAVHGLQTLSCDFAPPRDTVERLSLFMVREATERQHATRAVLSLADAETGQLLGSVERNVPAPGHAWRDDLQFETEWAVSAGRTYRLQLALPDASPADGLRLHMSKAAPGAAPRLTVAGRELPGRTLDFISFSSRPGFPTVLVVVGLALLALAIRRCARPGPDNAEQHLPGTAPGDSMDTTDTVDWARCTKAALLVTIGLAAVTSLFVWESAVWRFYGEYWPDKKVYLTHLLTGAFSGDNGWSEVWSLVSSHLHGATPLVPVALAALQRLGLPLIDGYVLLSLACGSATLVVADGFLRRQTTLQARQRALVVAMIGCHFIVLRGFARPQTDAAGVFFTLLFVSTLADLLSPSTSPARKRCATALAPIVLLFGLLARIALLPLLLVPPVLAGWRSLSVRGPARDNAVLAPLLVTVAGGALLAATYQLLGLWGSLEQLRHTAAQDEFSTLTLSAWAGHSAWVLQLALPLGLACRRRVAETLSLQLLLLTTVGFLSMLLVFQVIPWYRYWAPIGPLVMLFSGVLLFDGVRTPGRWRYALCAVTVLANLTWVALEKSY